MKTVLTLAAGLSLFATAAFAHAHLIHELPAGGATVSPAPKQLTLDFSEGVALKFTGVAVTGPKGAKVKLGHASLALGNDQELLVPLAAPLAPGNYTVAWHALSTDGHKTHGSYSFAVK